MDDVGLFLADLHTREATHFGTAAETLDECLDRRLLIFHERLLEQGDSLEEAVELAVDDLAECLLGLALFASLRLEDVALPGDIVGGDVVTADVAGCRARDVEGDVVRDFAGTGVGWVDTTELHEHADDATLVLHVLVRVEQPVGRLEARDAAELDLLAERAGQTLYVLVDR